MRKRSANSILIMSLMILLILIIGIYSTVAWLTARSSILLSSQSKISSELIDYFDYKSPTSSEKGTGTEDDPFIIAYPSTLYSFAWLQYLGKFNTATVEDNSIFNQYYFKVSNNLNMEGYHIPAIGTIEYPFFGSFDGDGHTISNLVVTSTYNDLEDDDSLHPAPLSQQNYSAKEIVGLFGVVGSYDADVGVYSGKTYNVEITEVKNMILDRVTVCANTSHALMGIVVGYLNAATPIDTSNDHYTVDKIGIVECDLVIGTGVSALSVEPYVISSYSAIGWCNAGYLRTLTLSNSGSINVVNPSGGMTGPNAWAGSLNFKTIFTRLSFMENATGWDSSYHSVYRVALSGTNFLKQLAGNMPVFPTSGNGTNVNLRLNTLMPISISNDIDTSYYDGITPERIAPINSSFMTGGNSSLCTFYYYPFSQTNNNGGNCTGSFNGVNAFSPQTLTLYTKNGSGTYAIQNNNNGSVSTLAGYTLKTPEELGLEKYDAVETGLFDALSINAVAMLRLGNVYTSTPVPTMYDNVAFQGTTYESYPLLNGAINIKARSTGTLALVLRFTNPSGVHRLPNLFHLNVAETGTTATCESVRLIDKIYADDAGLLKYEYTSGSPNTYAEEGFNEDTQYLKFDRSWMSLSYTAALWKCLLYTEIPLMKGNYAITNSNATVSGVSGTAYNILYAEYGPKMAQDSGTIPTPSQSDDAFTVGVPLGRIDYMESGTVLENYDWSKIVDIHYNTQHEEISRTEYFVMPVIYRVEFAYTVNGEERQYITNSTVNGGTIHYRAQNNVTKEISGGQVITAKYVEGKYCDSHGDLIFPTSDLYVYTYLCVYNLIASNGIDSSTYYFGN